MGVCPCQPVALIKDKCIYWASTIEPARWIFHGSCNVSMRMCALEGNVKAHGKFNVTIKS